MKQEKSIPDTPNQMTPTQLKRHVEKAGYESYFFSKETMKFFGDTMENYGVRDAGNRWELYRKKPVKHGLTKSTYFTKGTFTRVFK